MGRVSIYGITLTTDENGYAKHTSKIPLNGVIHHIEVSLGTNMTTLDLLIIPVSAPNTSTFWILNKTAITESHLYNVRRNVCNNIGTELTYDGSYKIPDKIANCNCVDFIVENGSPGTSVNVKIIYE